VVPEPEKQPDPTPSNEPPPGEQLGLDTQGSAGGDAFGLLGRKGGRDLLASGGSAFGWYAGLLKNEILEQLGNEKQARGGEYSILVRVWVRDDGTIDRVRIVQSSGNRDRDRAIEAALSRITRVSQAPPADMPQPISLRIVSHV
jgi:protein TonB